MWGGRDVGEEVAEERRSHTAISRQASKPAVLFNIQFNSNNFFLPIDTSHMEEQQGVSIPNSTYDKQ